MAPLMRRFSSRCDPGYNVIVVGRTNRTGWRMASLPSVVFAISFVLLGWIASHAIAYALVDLLPHAVSAHREPHIHGYMGGLKLAGGAGLVLAFAFALRALFRHGAFGDWLHKADVAGKRRQVLLSTIVPAAVFVLAEHAERWVAGTGTSPSAQLLAIGVVVQLVVGLLCLGLMHLTLHAAERIVARVAGKRRAGAPARDPAGLAATGVVLVLSPAPMAGSKAGRAPPAHVCSCR